MIYTGKKLREISFPLGGIGTGCIGLDGTGRLIDWELFNKPAKGTLNGYSHIAIRTKRDGKTVAAVLNGDLEKDLNGQFRRLTSHDGYGFGPDNKTMCGFPHFKDVEFDGRFPIAELDFKNGDFPAGIKMTAFNPFIPNDAYNSSLPAAFFEIEVENTTEERLTYQLAFSVANPYKASKNESSVKDGLNMISMYNAEVGEEDVNYGDLTVATDCDKAYAQAYWYRGSWMDTIVSFWNEFSSGEELKSRVYDTPGKNDTCTLMAEVDAAPGEKKKVKFVLTWNAPYFYNYWFKDVPDDMRKPWKNYYATVFENSAATAVYALEKWDGLYGRTKKFRDALYNISLPECVTDAAAANLSVLKSPTVFRLEDGSFYGWEGVGEVVGSCEGTCQHVWNYAYALCFLFPELERSIRDLEFKYSTEPNGKMGFRIVLPLGKGVNGFRACLDGQMGAVIKCYREWKISGDNEWLKENWDNIKRVLEYAWSEENPDKWDFDKDGVLEGRQHHTLDMELFGPSSWLEGMYLAALKAASEMASFLGDDEKASEYGELFEKGRKWTKENLFNGKWFVQKIDLKDKSITDKFGASGVYWNEETGEIKYQIGEGSSIDQLLGQWHADIVGLGDIFDREQVMTALSSMVKNNFKESMRGFVNPWRIFSLNDEAGSVICDYPEGTPKPKIPIPYCEETMTGFEHSFAGLLCSSGMTDEGIRAVKAVRDRFEGEKRNPWNEFECGSNYARSMASYALIPILSGFEFDMPHNHMGFKPYRDGDFNSIWSLWGAWGVFEREDGRVKISVKEGAITLKSLGLGILDSVSEVKLDGKRTDFKFEDGVLSFEKHTVHELIEITA